jgi:hypothetical protein
VTKIALGKGALCDSEVTVISMMRTLKSLFKKTEVDYRNELEKTRDKLLSEATSSSERAEIMAIFSRV